MIFSTLSTIRRYLVQTRAQYEYVYRCCQAFLEGRFDFLANTNHFKHLNFQDEKALPDWGKSCLAVLLFVNVIFVPKFCKNLPSRYLLRNSCIYLCASIENICAKTIANNLQNIVILCQNALL